jgi:4-hydroxythreonine-4-phosphate dehydrogenase
MGDPAGIGGELTLMAWQRRSESMPPFAVLDDPDRLEWLGRRIGLAVRCQIIADPAETAACWPDRLPVMPVPLAAPTVPGEGNPANAATVVGAIEQGVAAVMAGGAGALVTNPINKRILHGAGFTYPGHTEFLGALAGMAAPPVMMLAGPSLKVVPVTIHVSLRQALAMLDTPTIVAAGRVTAAALSRDFGIDRPRLAVAGLNPHAGEGGAFGPEDIEIVAPAVAELRALGIEVVGPLPPDTMFHAAARAGYDAALCMYHDQALIPLKTLDFDQGVNVTLGLPFIRTSPDHGTAFDIAGTGTANPSSFIAALRMAAQMAEMRARSDG